MTLDISLICVTFIDVIIYPKTLRYKFIRIVVILFNFI